MITFDSLPTAARISWRRLPWIAFAVLCGTVLADLALYLAQLDPRSTALPGLTTASLPVLVYQKGGT